MRQHALFCPCGSAKLFAKGRCLRCYKAHWRDRHYFDGLRSAAIARDGRCLVCGEPERAKLIVHHRKPGVNALERLATSCRGCHCQIHLRKRLSFALAAKFKALWREQHRDQAQQLELEFGVEPSAEQGALFAAA